jgi:hypothetical protein
MPALDRRLTTVSDKAIGLFAAIENGPAKARKPYSAETRELAYLLDLGGEWWGGVTVCDRERVNPYQPWHCAHDYWLKCRGIRSVLVREAVKRGLLSPANRLASAILRDRRRRKRAPLLRRQAIQPDPS